MASLVANTASDAAQSVADSLNQGALTGWDMVAAAAVVVASIPLARVAANFSRRAIGRIQGTPAPIAADLGRVVKWLVYMVALAIVFSILGVNVGFLSAMFVLALIFAALMMKPMVENSASGMLLLARPSFSVGDQIKTTTFRGTVTEIGSRSTVLRTDVGTFIHV